MTLSSLDQRFPIVDPNTGKPTDYFLRLLRSNSLSSEGTIGDLEEEVADLQGDVSNLQIEIDNLELGDLSDVDLITTPPTDQQVIAFDEPTGLWLPADQSGGGGGGGGIFFGGSYGTIVPGTSGNATRSIFAIPSIDLSITELRTMVQSASAGHQYIGQISTVNPGTGQIITVLATSNVASPGTTLPWECLLVFSSPVNLTAGTIYCFSISMISSTGTTACRAYFTSTGFILGMPHTPVTPPNTGANYGVTSLTNGQAASSIITSGDAYVITASGTV